MKLFKNLANNDIILGADTDTPVSPYSDVTTLLEVGSNKDLLNLLEYNSIRKWVGALFQAKGFDNCTNEERIILCKWILLPYTTRLLFVTDEQDKNNWDELVMRTEGNPIGYLQGRAKIYQNLRICVSDYVRKEAWVLGDYYANLTLSQTFFRDVAQMKEFYIGANDPEFGEFLRSNGRYDATTGLQGKDYYLPTLETELINIYNSY